MNKIIRAIILVLVFGVPFLLGVKHITETNDEDFQNYVKTVENMEANRTYYDEEDLSAFASSELIIHSPTEWVMAVPSDTTSIEWNLNDRTLKVDLEEVKAIGTKEDMQSVLTAFTTCAIIIDQSTYLCELAVDQIPDKFKSYE